MAIYTINTSPDEEEVLDRVLPILNTYRLAEGLPPLNKTQLVRGGFGENLQEWKDDVKLAISLRKATPALRQQIRNLLRA